MLRSIADIARSEGEKIKSIEAKLACLEVFALGGKSPTDDATETGYFVVRAALAREISEAAKYIAKEGLVGEGAPAIIRFITSIASRFGVTVSEKNCGTGCAYYWSSGRRTNQYNHLIR